MTKNALFGTSSISANLSTLAAPATRTQGVTVVGALLLAFLSCLLPEQAFAKKRLDDWFNLSGFYSEYGKAGGAADSLPKPAPSADIDLAVRVYGKLSLSGTLSNTVEPDPTDVSVAQYRIRMAGGGLKLDLPGVFFLFGEMKEFKKSAKGWPISSFIIADALTLTLTDVTTSTETKYLAGRFAIGVDLFPFTELSHFTLKFSYLNFSNAGYWVYSFGGGLSF